MFSFVKSYPDNYYNIKNAKTRGFFGHGLDSSYNQIKNFKDEDYLGGNYHNVKWWVLPIENFFLIGTPNDA